MDLDKPARRRTTGVEAIVNCIWDKKQKGEPP